MHIELRMSDRMSSETVHSEMRMPGKEISLLVYM